MRYVIRSMSTTDWRPGQQVVPYHIYLLPSRERGGAWWSSSHYRAERYETLEDAQVELAALNARQERSWRSQGWTGPVPTSGQIVPEDARGLPSFWEYRG